MTALPLTVIGGYLGAGKTTLVNRLLSIEKGLRVAVLVNDFGSVNIDVDLIRSHAGDTINLANGCMCCSLINGFAAAMHQLLDRVEELDHIVIEASGVADPGKVAQQGKIYQLSLQGILVVADAEQIRTQAADKYVGKTVIRQFTQADLIVLNKTDLVTMEERGVLKTWFSAIAPQTAVIETTHSRLPMDVLLGIQSPAVLNLSNQQQDSSQDDHVQPFESWTIEQETPLSKEALNNFAHELGDDIYRVKGFIYLQNDQKHRYIYQQVGSRYTLQPDVAWNNNQPFTCLVIIGRRGSTNLVNLKALLQEADSPRAID
jgi:G3E family GTPase